MAKTLREQVGAAWSRSDLSLPQVKEKFLSAYHGVDRPADIDTSSLGRKLRGKQQMTTTECEVFAKIFGIQVVFGRDRRAA